MKKWKIILVSMVFLLLACRLALPYVLMHYVEKQINKLPEYHAKIDDLDVHLYRGSYTIKKFQLWKITHNIPVPFFESDLIDLSVEWGALLNGSIVAKIIASHPVIHFVDDKNPNKQQLTIDSRWVDLVESLFPLYINSVVANKGEIYFQNFDEDVPFTTYLKDARFEMYNMQNAKHSKESLSSSFSFAARPMDNGSLNMNGKFDPFGKRPTFYLKGELKSLNIRYIANLLKHYTKVDVVKGNFSLYGEFAAKNNHIEGYAKPFIQDLKIGDPKKENPLEQIYNGAAAIVAKVVENSDKKTIATKIKISGNIDDPDTSLLSIIGYLLRHAFIQALIPQVDHSVEMKDVVYGHSSS